MKPNRIIAFLLSLSFSLVLLFSTTTFANQSSSMPLETIELTEQSAISFAKNEIRRIASEGDLTCTWNDTTEIYYTKALYDYTDHCNGYVFKLSTGDTETGYMQVNQFNSQLSTFAYSFTGIPAYEGLAYGSDDILKHSAEKLYFFGNMLYCSKLDNGNFQPIDSPTEITAENVASKYQSYLSQVQHQKEEYIASENSNTNTSEKNFIQARAAFTPVKMSDFSNLYATRPNGTKQQVTQHCSPTAATNIMLCFRSIGDSPLSSSLSNSTIFMELYYALDTNAISTSNTVQANGTTRSKIQPGIKKFCSNRSCSPSSIGTITSVTLAKIKNHIDDGELLLASLDDFSGAGGHSVVFVNYTGNNVYLCTGWDTSYHWYAYSNLKIPQFVYVGY